MHVRNRDIQLKIVPLNVKNHPSSVKEVKKAKVQQKKVWKPKEAQLKELKKNVDLKALHVEADKVIENILEEENISMPDTVKVYIEK